MSLINKDLILYRYKVLLATLVIIIISFIAVVVGHNLISLRAGGGVQGLFLLYLLLLWIGGGFFTSTNLGDLRTIGNRISYIGTPASSLEKVLVKLLYTLPLYAGGISLIIYIFYWGYMSIYGAVLPDEAITITDKLSTHMALYFLRFYVFGHAVAFFFSFYYNTYASIKGALVSGLAFIGFCLIRTVFLLDNGFGYLENLGESTWELIIHISINPNLFMFIAPIFWIMSYIVFKRKSV